MPFNNTILKLSNTGFDSKKFIFDQSADYLSNYGNSCCLITDMSGTAYTYAFFTLKPVIFYSKNETKLKNHQLSKLGMMWWGSGRAN